MKKIFIRGPYNYDTKAESDDCVVSYEGVESLTIQSMAEDTDINVIMERFGVTGRMPEQTKPLMYGDFENIYDFRTAQDAILRGREVFMDLPAKVRARFQNDPQEYVDFCSDETNLGEMRKMGIAVPEVVVENKPVEVVKPGV